MRLVGTRQHVQLYSIRNPSKTYFRSTLTQPTKRFMADTNNKATTNPVRAIITGCTGNLGNEVVRQCLADARFESVTAIVRKELDISHEKLHVLKLSDFKDYSKVEDQLRNHDVCYWCLGISTTKVNKEQYREITVDYTLAGASAMKKVNPNLRFFFVSGNGADPTMKSSILFARVKGETEVKLGEMGFNQLVIWRPGYIKPIREVDQSFSEKALGLLATVLTPIMPSIATDPIEISKAFFYATFNSINKTVLENADIKSFAKKETEASTSPN